MLSTLVELAGCLLVIAGVGLVSVPAALVVAGVLVLVVSWLNGGDA